MASVSGSNGLRISELVCLSLLLPLALSQADPPKLLLITMDSLMYKMIEDINATSIEHFDFFRKNGVLLKQMMNVFPSHTYPNHYTLITGLYPESHGIVHNNFYDPVLKDHFHYTVSKHNLDSKWYDVGAEPIYVTNSKGGGRRKSGTVLFPTGMATVKGIAPDRKVEDDGTYSPSYPDYGFPFVNMTYRDRVDRIIDWFTADTAPINLGLLYFSEPDELSHEHGPDSPEVRNEIIGPLNDALGYLVDKLRDNNLTDAINVILTADHGQTTFKRFVYIDDYIDSDSYTVGGQFKNGIVIEMYPKEGKEDEIIQNLTRSSEIAAHKKDCPGMTSLHYSKNIRIAPLILVATDGTVILKREYAGTVNLAGLHGYDPHKVSGMRPLFMAMGPSFKKGLVSNQFNSVDVYPLMCHLLGINPAPNNGSLDNVLHLLVETSGAERNTIQSLSTFGGLLVTLLVRAARAS